MPKITLSPVVSLTNVATINSNFVKIEEEINNKMFSRKPEGEPNVLDTNIDLNGYKILNVPKPIAPTDIVRLQDIGEIASPDLSSKQDVLVSGTNIKTINNQSVLGSGNLDIAGGTNDHATAINKTLPDQHPISSITGLQVALDDKAPTGHTHSVSDVSGLQASLDSKASSVHTHAIVDVTGLQTALDSKASTTHSHVISDVTGLQTALDGKASTSVATTSVNGLMSSTDKTKLNGIATGATVNSPDATLLARANHTGSQAISTVTNLQTTLDGKQATLVSGTNIKTINGTSVLGSGNIVISGGGGGGLVDGDYGDVVVSGTGTVMTLDASITASINRAKLFGLIGMTR